MVDVMFLVYFTCFCLYQDLVFCDDYGKSGNKITLTPSIRGKPEEILWTHNGNKVLEYDGKQMDTYGSFKDRVDLDFETGELTIRKLNNQDSGTYQSEIWINKNVQVSRYTLTVLDALPEPLVTCEVDRTSNVKKLFCSVESQTEPSYEWSGSDVKHPGPTLVVNEQEENLNSVYTCTVKNKAGSRTTDFNLQDCTTGRAKSAVLVPVLIVILLLIILLAFYIYRHKRQQLHAREVRKPGLNTVELEKGECKNLLRDEPTETMPASSQATLPCRNRLTAPNKKWDQDSELENGDETHEGQKLLKESPQSAITGKNKDDTGNTNGELDKNKENSGNADEAEESANSEAEKTNTEVENQKFLETQEEKEKSQILENKSEDEEKTPEDPTETLGEQENKNADKNKSEDEEKKPEDPSQNLGEQENKNADKNKSEDEEKKPEDPSQNLGEQENKNADKNKSEDEEKKPEKPTENLGEQENKNADKNEEDRASKVKKEKEEENKEIDNTNKEILSPQSAVTGRITVDTGNVDEQLHKNEKSSQNENGEQSSEQQNKSLSINEDDQRPEREDEEKTEKENHEVTGILHTDSPSNLDTSDPSSNLNMELENNQAASLPQEEDDDDEKKDKSSESEQGRKEKKDVPEIKETKNNFLDNTITYMLPEDKKAETETSISTGGAVSDLPGAVTDMETEEKKKR